MSTKKSLKSENSKKGEEQPKIEKGVNILDKLGDIELENEKNEKVNIQKLVEGEEKEKEHRGIVIFMYPKANTPGCTKQACGFNENFNEFENAGFSIYGLSRDAPNAQSSWQRKYSLRYSLLSDVEGQLIKFFGCDKAPGTVRSHVVIAKDGEILDCQRAVSPGDSYTMALEVAKSVGKTNGEGNKNKKKENEKEKEKSDSDTKKEKETTKASTPKKKQTEKKGKEDNAKEKNAKENESLKETEKKEKGKDSDSTTNAKSVPTTAKNKKNATEKKETEKTQGKQEKEKQEKGKEEVNNISSPKKNQSEKKNDSQTKKQKEKEAEPKAAATTDKKEEKKEKAEEKTKKNTTKENKSADTKKRKSDTNVPERKSQRIKNTSK